MSYMKYSFILIIIALFTLNMYAQEDIQLVTYGPNAETIEGDDDYGQIIYFSIPDSLKRPVFLRIFDPDAGGRVDAPFGDWNTVTKFMLYGGDSCFTPPVQGDSLMVIENSAEGRLIKQVDFGSDPYLDNKWYNFATLTASQGQKSGDDRIFKLVVEGSAGNDGNIFEVALSLSEKKNLLPDGGRIFSYVPTFRLPARNIFAELRFLAPPGTKAVDVYNFDVAGGEVSVVTKYRSGLDVPSSGQDTWSGGRVELNEDEQGVLNAVKFEKGNEIPNDATFYLMDTDGNYIPFELPVLKQKPNRRPVPKYSWKTLADCYTVIFDGSESSDLDGDAMSFLWHFGDGTKKEGVRVAHTFEDTKQFNVTLEVTDESGVIENTSRAWFDVTLNQPPTASAGEDMIVAPGESVGFSASASIDPDGNISRYAWEFGDGEKAEGNNVTHIYNKAARYKVTLRVEDDSDSPCNFAVDQITVWVNSPPVVEVGSDKIASVNETVKFDGGQSYDSDGEIVQYLWDYGDGATGNGRIVEHQYSAPGDYNVTLKVIDNTDVTNNNASDQLVVAVNDKPVAEAGDDQGVAAGQIVEFSGGKSLDRDGKLIDYSWTFGDGASANGMDVTHAYEKPGVYTANLTITDDSKSTTDKDNDNLKIVVNFPPVSKAGPDQTVTSSIVHFDGSASSDEDGELTAYDWDFGDKTTGQGIKTSHIYSNPGTYKVTLKVTDDSKTTSGSDSDELTVVVNQKPIADAGPDIIAATGEVVNFDAGSSTDPDGEISSYAWDFGDGNKGEGKQTEHSWAEPGYYTVRLKVADNTGHENAAGYDETVVRINTPPVAIAGKDLVTSPGVEVEFNASFSFDIDKDKLEWFWSFSDQDTETEGKIVKRSFPAPGIYTANLRVEDNSGALNYQSEDKLIIHVNHPPEAVLGDDIRTCNLNVFFDASKSVDPDGDALNYTWDFGDGAAPESGLKVYHTFGKSGTFPIVLTVNDGKNLPNSVHSTSMIVFINHSPEADAGPDRTICAGDIVLFDGSGTKDPEGGLLKYYWDFGDDTKAEGMNPTKTYKKGGAYEVTLTVKDDSGLPCNTDVDQAIVYVADAPIADAGEDQTVCASTIVQFDGTNSYDFDGMVNNYSWDFGDGTTGGGAKPTHVYEKPGVYRVLLTITGDLIGDCDNSDKDEMTVTVLDAPISEFSAPKMAPVSEPVTFNGSKSSGEGSNITAWNWEMGDGTTETGDIIEHVYSKPGKYFIKLNIETDSETQCSSAPYQDYIIINDGPVAVAGEDKFGGVNEDMIFNASSSRDSDGSIVNYSWDFGDGTTARGIESVHRYSEPGVFNAVLTVKDNTEMSNNTSKDTVEIRINYPPEPVINMPEIACPQSELTFDAASTRDNDSDVLSFHWDFGDGFSSDTVTVLHQYNKPGIYTVTLSVDDGKGTLNSRVSLSRKIKINYKPYAFAGPDVELCPGEEYNFSGDNSTDADDENLEYRWDFGDGITAPGKSAPHAFEKPGSYKVILSVDDLTGSDCGVAMDTVDVFVNSSPVAKASAITEGFTGGAHDDILFDGTASFDPDKDPLTYRWDMGDGSKYSGPSIMHKYQKPGTYKVTLTVSDGRGAGCSEAFDVIELVITKR